MNELGKLPPQAIEFERALLGALLMESFRMIEISNIVRPESFYKDEHQKIYQIIDELFNDEKPIDMLIVTEKARQKKILDEIGGPACIAELSMSVSSGSHADFHARIIQQKFMQREMIRISSDINQKAFDDSIDIDDLIDYSQEQINQLTTGNIKKLARKLGDVGKERIKEIEELSKSDKKITGVRTFKKIEKITGGWNPPNSIIIAARPGQGKTMLAIAFARLSDKPVLIFSLEMMDKEIYDRELSSSSGIENMYLRSGNITAEDWIKIESAQRIIEEREIYIDDTGGLSVKDFKSKSRLYKKKFGIGLIIIDYMQLMRSPEHRKFREQEISYISSSIKGIAKELNLPIITLSQLNRKVDDRTDKRPKLSDLRESGSIEQDADMVAFIHRPEEYKINEDEYGNSTKNLIEFIIAKNRHGPVGTIKLFKTNNWTEINEHQSEELNNSDIPQTNEESPF